MKLQNTSSYFEKLKWKKGLAKNIAGLQSSKQLIQPM